jgi:hypothetical protein
MATQSLVCATKLQQSRIKYELRQLGRYGLTEKNTQIKTKQQTSHK